MAREISQRPCGSASRPCWRTDQCVRSVLKRSLIERYDYWESCTAATLYARRRTNYKDTYLRHPVCFFETNRYLTIVAGWDNSPRYEAQNRTSVYQVIFGCLEGFDDAQASVWAGFTPELFKRHAEQVLRQCKDFARHPIVFVNAWNEWNEQAVMEPCTRWGTAVLDALESAIKNYMIPAKVSEVHKSLSVLPPETLTNVSVLLITSEEIPLRPESDEQISELIPHIEWYNMHDKQTTFHHILVTPKNPLDRQQLFHLMRTRKPHLILTVGTFTNEMRILNTMPFAFRRLWVNWSNWEQVHPIAVMGAVHNCMFNHHLDHSHPLISVVTTAYKSGDRILRPFLSLLRQSYDNWEFVIVLDDDDDATWSILQHIQDRDFRVRVYRPSIRAGRIGEAKRDAFMLARGKILVEVDHDDELSDDCLKWLKDAYTALLFL